MRKQYFSIICIFLIALFTGNSCSNQQQTKGKSPVDYVNPYMGNISHLLVPTYPTVHLPNSMLRVIPKRIDFTGDRLIGLPVALVNHRGKSTFSIHPVSQTKQELQPVNTYSYDNEIIKPYTYDVYLDEEEIEVSFAVSHQAGIYSFQFKNAGGNVLLINNENGELNIEKKSVFGYQDIGQRYSKGNPKIYLYAEINEEVQSAGILNNGSIGDSKTGEGRNICAGFSFKEQIDEVVLKYGISFISVEQAKQNLEREIPDFDLEKVKEYGRKKWNESLSKINVTGGSENDKTVFYTSLYRTYERPVCISEDGKYFSAFDGEVHEDNGEPFYTDDWIWDTYRATHPLRILTEKEMELDIIRSFIKMAEQMDNLWMPTFPDVTGDGRKMNSNHGVATVLDANVKGLTDFDLEKAYKACKGAITEKTLAPWSGMPAGELDEFYKNNGYIPALKEGEEETIPEVHSFESRQPVAVTLGTVYDEWCLGQIASILGKKDEFDYFNKRGSNYRLLYNAETGFFHPKDADGNFIEPFDYKFSGGMGARQYYDENNGWTYRWDVPHAVADLVNLMGGPEMFVNNLDATFNEELGKSKYRFYAQLPDQTGNVGQFSMANEPSLHIPYLYNYAGQPWKTQKRIKQLIHQWFRNDLMGVPGDEDGGGMSAFVVFSMLGFYPVTPGLPVYNIGSPFFETAEIDLGDNKKLLIKANNHSPDNKYIQSATLNGKDWNKPWFNHEDIENGGILELEMGKYANKMWCSSHEEVPPSGIGSQH